MRREVGAWLPDDRVGAPLRWLDTRRGFVVAVLAVVVVFSSLRLISITRPSKRVFDEVYAPLNAVQLLRGEPYLAQHPLLAAAPFIPSLLLFGDTPLGWRLAPWFWSIVFTIGTALTAWLLSGRRLAGVLAALLVSLDTAYFLYGRTGLPDMFLLSQLSLALACFFASGRFESRRKATLAALASGVFLGNLVSTKWLGLAATVSVWAFIAVQGVSAWWHTTRAVGETGAPGRLLPNIPRGLYPLAFVAVPAATYAFWTALFLWGHVAYDLTWHDVLGWHRETWQHHAHLEATHADASFWWQWPLAQKPIRLYLGLTKETYRLITLTGNVVLWWSGAAAVAWAIVGALLSSREGRTGTQPGAAPPVAVTLWLAFSALVFWLPWAFISRPAFLYHYLPSLFFELLLLALVLTGLLSSSRWRYVVYLFLIAAAVDFAVLLPDVLGIDQPRTGAWP